MAINDTPFQSQGLAGLYDRNLSAANQMAQTEAYNQANRRRSFTDLITTGITTANNAMQSEQNRKAQMELQQLQDQAARDQAAQAQLNKIAFEQEKNKLGIQAGYNALDKYSETRSKTFESAPTVDSALKGDYLGLVQGYRMSSDPTSKQFYESELMDATGATTPEELAQYLTGQKKVDFSSPYFDYKRELKTAQMNAKVDEQLTKTLEKQKKDTEISNIVTAGKTVAEQNDDIENLLEDTADLGTKEFIQKQIRVRNNLLSDSEKAKAFNKKADSFFTARDQVDQVADTGLQLVDTFKEVEDAGASLQLGPLYQAVMETLLDKDAQSAQNFMTKIREMNLFENTGNLTPAKIQELTNKIIVNSNLIVGNMTSVGRAVLGQTGVQTEGDFQRNMGMVFAPGNSMDVRIENLRRGIGMLTAGTVAGSIKYGDINYAKDQINYLKDRGIKINRLGSVDYDSASDKRIPFSPAAGFSFSNQQDIQQPDQIPQDALDSFFMENM